MSAKGLTKIPQYDIINSDELQARLFKLEEYVRKGLFGK